MALVDALLWLQLQKKLNKIPLRDYLAAISVGVVEGELMLDLCYEEDSRASVDMNVVMTGAGKLVEIQGTAEGAPFDRNQLDRLLNLAERGIDLLIKEQKRVLGDAVVAVIESGWGGETT